MNISNKLKVFLKENKLFILLFIFSTSFFIFQRLFSFSWDFNAYVLNAKYFFSNGTYFEPYRPPLAPFIIGILSIFGWKVAELIFVFLTSLIFAYSTYKLSKCLNFNPSLFYFFSLNFFTLSFGTFCGTELLSMSFLQLSLFFIISNNPLSGIFLALGALSRYTLFYFFPLILFHFNFKKMIKSFFLFVLTISPWLIYNFYKFGNFFTSIADQYAQNILYRGYFTQKFNIFDVLFVQNLFLPFFVIGFFMFFISIFKYVKKKRRKFSLNKFFYEFKAEILMTIVFLITIYSYAKTPLKDARYLFNLILPTAFFSYKGVEKIVKRINKNSLKNLFFLLIFLFYSIFLIKFLSINFYYYTNYERGVEKIRYLNLSNCSIMSNQWINLNYMGISSEPFPDERLLIKRINEGKILILFKDTYEPSYTFNESLISSLPIIENNENYVIIGNEECAISKKGYNKTYLESIDELTSEVYGYRQNTNPCFILFMKAPLLEKFCNFINFNGFKLDEYRVYN